MNGNIVIEFRPPTDIEAGMARLARHRSIDSMVEAFREHCHDGGGDFFEYLKPWHAHEALERINDAAQNHTPLAAIGIIKKALEELFEIAAEGHREALEWEGIE